MGVTLADAIVYFQGNADQLKEDLAGAESTTESSVTSMASMFSTVLVAGIGVAATAIVGIGTAAFDVASDIDSATDQIGASLGLTDAQAKKFGETVKKVYGDNFGDSIEDVGKSIETVAKQLRLTADDPSLVKVTENAFRLRDVFGVEVTESIDAVKTLMDQFGVSSDEAFDLLADGYQRGMDRSGDFLDTIGEYSVQFANGGASASEFFKFIETGMQGGILGTDKAADAFKEFGIRILDNSTLTRDSLAALGISYDELTQGFADGSETTANVLQDVLYQIFQLDDPIQRATIGVGLFGTQWEDLGESSMRALSEIEEGFGVHEGAVESLDTKYTSLGSVVEGMWRQFQVGIAPAGEAILGFVNDNLPLIQNLVGDATGAIVGFVNYIPFAFGEVKRLWDEDWAGMRTTWRKFADELPDEQQRFWDEWNSIFKSNSATNEVDWENFIANVFERITNWFHFAIEALILFLSSWRRTTALWNAAISGDWDAFWTQVGDNFKASLDLMLSFLDIFNLGFKDKMIGGFQDAWNGLKSLWTDFTSWWSSTFGGLLGIEFPNPSIPNLGVVSPFNVPDLNVPSLIPGGINGQSNTQTYQFGNIHVNVGNGVDPYDAGRQTGKGITDELRLRGAN